MASQRSPFDLIRVTAVRHVREHVLWLQFSDGLAGEVDLRDGLIGPVFEPLRDPREFARVRLGTDTIEWPNGADWAPEAPLATQAGVHGLLVKTDDTHNKGASGTCSIYAGAAGSEADTTMNITAYNRFANLASGKWAWVGFNADQAYLTAGEC